MEKKGILLQDSGSCGFVTSVTPPTRCERLLTALSTATGFFFSDLFKPICCLFKQNKTQVAAFHIGIIMAGISKIEQLFLCTERASNQDTNAFKLCCIITFNSCRIHLLRFKSDI